MNTSNSFSQRDNNLPFRTPFHLMSSTVLTSCPAISPANRRSMHSSSSIFNSEWAGQYFRLGFLEECDDLITADSREPVEELIDGRSIFQVFYQSLGGHSGPRKYGCPTHNLRVNNNHAVHEFIMRNTASNCKNRRVKISW